MTLEYQVTDRDGTVRLLHILKSSMKLSTRLINRLKACQGLLVNGIPMRTIDPVKPGDLVTVRLEEDETHYTTAEEIPITILHEDDWFLALNKPAGMPVHPSAGHASGTLSNAVQWHYQKLGRAIKTRPVNRLDRDTSGVTLFAKHSHAQDQLIRLMKTQQVHKEYLGLVEGLLSPECGTIDLPIMRKPGSVMERIIHPEGDPSVTHYETLLDREGYSLVRFILETGRTHQIRIHTKAMGHPLLGDWLYAYGPSPLITRQALHSHKLRFLHPATGEILEIVAPVPADMLALIDGWPMGYETRPIITGVPKP